MIDETIDICSCLHNGTQSIFFWVISDLSSPKVNGRKLFLQITIKPQRKEVLLLPCGYGLEKRKNIKILHQLTAEYSAESR